MKVRRSGSASEPLQGKTANFCSRFTHKKTSIFNPGIWILSKMPRQPSPEVPLHARARALVCARALVAWQGRQRVISSSVKEEHKEEETVLFPAG